MIECTLSSCRPTTTTTTRNLNSLFVFFSLDMRSTRRRRLRRRHRERKVNAMPFSSNSQLLVYTQYATLHMSTILMQFYVAKIQSIRFAFVFDHLLFSSFFYSFAFAFSFDILTHCNATHSITNRPDDIRLRQRQRRRRRCMLL